jgi:hypothetical protein
VRIQSKVRRSHTLIVFSYVPLSPKHFNFENIKIEWNRVQWFECILTKIKFNMIEVKATWEEGDHFEWVNTHYPHYVEVFSNISKCWCRTSIQKSEKYFIF